MEEIHQIDVISLDDAHRRALENVIGTHLRQDQRLTINVSEASPTPVPAASRRPQTMADWKRVYEGLTEEQIEAIHRDMNTRADLTRHLP
jgi:hypothetical protein